MPKILNIFDISTYIHAGHVNKHAKFEKLVDAGSTWKSLVTPCGGAAFLFKSIYEVGGSGDMVFACDRNPTIKKDLYPGYKESRVHRRDIEVDKAVTEYLLEKCGYTVIARAGYEADDIIYTLVTNLKKQYDEIRIYTADSDLFFLVDDNISIYPSNSNGKFVNLENYEKTKVHGCYYRYNTITTSKIVHGDYGDGIYALSRADQKEFQEIFFQEPVLKYHGNKEVIVNMAKFACPQLLNQVLVVFPLDVENLPDTFSKPDYQMIMNFGDAMGSSFFRGRSLPNFDITPYIEEMHSNGWYVD